jgi:hypothetical protein
MVSKGDGQLFGTRERDRPEAAFQTLERLSEHHFEAKHYSRAQQFARQQMALEPWRERTHRQLTLALALEERGSVECCGA